MSVTETDPDLIACTPSGGVQLLQPRDVPLGGPRAMHVRRTLPQRERSLIGAWCFVDHYGPDDLADRGGMQVPGHPHTGLATVTWLFQGEVEHRDTLGTTVVIRPGEVNLMTAGRGIAHSEYSTGSATTVHGVQLWFALPDGVERARFQHAAPTPLVHDGATVRVFVGDWLGSVDGVSAGGGLVAAEVRLQPGQRWRAPVDPDSEVGVLVDTGVVTVDGITAESGRLAALPVGRTQLDLEAGSEGARVIVLSGEPFPHDVVMWWNFVGRTHEEIVAAREDWQRQVEQLDATGAADGRFGPYPEVWARVLPAPELPTVRLRPRRRAGGTS